MYPQKEGVACGYNRCNRRHDGFFRPAVVLNSETLIAFNFKKGNEGYFFKRRGKENGNVRTAFKAIRKLCLL